MKSSVNEDVCIIKINYVMHHLPLAITNPPNTKTIVKPKVVEAITRTSLVPVAAIKRNKARPI